MVTALARIFLKDVKMNDSQGRKAYGTLCSVVGIFLTYVYLLENILQEC